MGFGSIVGSIAQAVTGSGGGSSGGSGGSGGSFAGDLGGGLMSGAMDLGFDFLGSKLISEPMAKDAYKRTKNLQRLAFERSYNAYKKRYQITVDDMIAAGINPILAASHGFQVSGSPQMSAQSAPMAQLYTSRPAASARNYAQAGLADEQQMQSKAKTLELYASAEKQRANALESMSRVRTERIKRRLMTAQENKTYVEINKLQNEFRKISAELLKTRQVTENTKQKYKLLVQQEKQLKYLLKQLNKTSQWYKGSYGDFLGWLGATMRALNLNLGIIGGLPK